ncbi:LOW QUALITY PROTEIN: sodium/bile acid cotransporter 5 [Neophocaena asiaeorientalis asiaeorientalis]|uniref:LOW QUALITY PROTEIN: sodium/bile acid cotransporter 5 n=1 Tax=Neophocaena asiaeorientalis asiaeorientalis TaxID=1706337 RepID=A0A341ACM2_NEOAA|nr:LOW QUALITY PROTEIN: sodium/bile acid cotransporter 5 [Neophocaena asiaeorientalis asiaeorientalis]
MIRKLFMVLLLSSVTLGEAKKSFLSFLNIEKTEILFFTKTEETVVVRSSYRDKQPNSSYLFVQLEDPKMLQVVNVTKTLSDVTNFTINLVTDEDGETNLTIQLWDSEGRQERLIEEIKNVKVRVLKQRQDSLFQTSNLIDRNILMLFLPMILLNKCAFGCKIELQVFQTIWKRPLPIILGAVIQFFLMPFCGFHLTQILALPEAQVFGFVMTCTCPGGGGGYLFALLLEGDVTLAILMTCTSTLLALIMMPANSYIYSRMLGLSRNFHIPVSKIMSTLLFVLIPISVGIIIKRRLPEKANFLERIIRPLSFILMFVGIYLTFRMGLMFLKTVNLEVLLLGVLVPALGLSFGYFFAKMSMLPLPVCKTVAIEGGVLNSFLALAIIQLSFSRSNADLASVAPFTVAMCSGCEILLILLFYKAKKRCILIIEEKRKKNPPV